MKLIEGFDLAELTEDKIVQEMHFGETGVIRMTGNPNPPAEEHQKAIDAVARILLKGYQRRQQRETE